MCIREVNPACVLSRRLMLSRRSVSLNSTLNATELDPLSALYAIVRRTIRRYLQLRVVLLKEEERRDN